MEVSKFQKDLCKLKIIESLTDKTQKVLKQIQYKRFMISINDIQLSLMCHWYAQPAGSIVPADNANDNTYQRPDDFRT